MHASYSNVPREPIVANPQELIHVVRDARLRATLSRIQSEPSCSANELAREVRLSPAHLQRLFKHETGLNISTLLVENRLQIAARLLSGSDLPIRGVAYAVGYRQHSSFVRAFQRRFAQTPKHFRTRQGGQSQ
jgi:transcriptional regulator GlxA family with amidase domain